LSQRVYYVDKSSGTFADALLAFGAAAVLREVLIQCGVDRPEVRLLDHGQAYGLELSTPLDAGLIQRCPFFVPIPFLRTAKNAPKLPAGLPEVGAVVANYEYEKQRRVEYLAIVVGLPTEAKKAWRTGQPHPALEALAGKGIHEHWDILRAINPGALDAYNNCVAQWWLARSAFGELLATLLSMLATTPNQAENAEKLWVEVCKKKGLPKPKRATAAQLLNPAQGKGQNRPKCDGASMQNLDAFWLPEYLKAVGLYQAAITHIVANPRDPRNAKDRKTYVLAPRDLLMGMHVEIMQKYRGAMVRTETAVKLDILASLRYAQAFLQYAEEAHTPTTKERLLGKRPDNLVSGLQTAFYKNLGNSAATMNIAALGLPSWVRAGEKEELQQFHALLAEHRQIVGRLDETHTDAYELLVFYRDFVSGNDLRPFFEFTTAYGGFLMREIERGRRCPALTTTNLEVLLMNTEKRLETIVQNSGFQNIAYAIRHSTVIPQARKAKNLPGFTVRYGLGQRLARKANYADDFVAELTQFLRDYNTENEQQFERTGQRLRKGVRTQDIEDIVRLVDAYGAKVVCNLLVAYGYARTPWAGLKGGEQPGEEAMLPGERSGDQLEDDSTLADE